MKSLGVAALLAVGAVAAQSLIPLTPDIRPGTYYGLVAPRGTDHYKWALVTQLDTYHDKWDGVSIYAKTNRIQGNAPAFGIVSEVQDVTGQGAIWGLEVDAITTGRGKPWEPRVGVGVVYGKNHRGEAPAVIDYGYWLLPWHVDGSQAKVLWGFRAEVGCEIACVSVPPGSWVTFDHAGNVGMRFDEQTGYLHFGVRGKPPAMSLQMETGQVLRLGK